MSNRSIRYLVTGAVIVFTFQSNHAAGQAGMASFRVPPNLAVPAGNIAYLKTHAIGTQNYACVPGANGPFWKFLGPQATLFVPFPWIRREAQLQVATHFLSANPSEGGTPRPTWQSSLDTSAVWGRAAADSSDPEYVAPGAIPWLLVQVTGAQPGPMGGTALAHTTYIQRVKTSGGIAPSGGCQEAAYGQVALVPYITEYIFYRLATPK